MLKDGLFEPCVPHRGENHLQTGAVQPAKSPVINIPSWLITVQDQPFFSYI